LAPLCDQRNELLSAMGSLEQQDNIRELTTLLYHY
jgi:hypothetical protein